MLKGGLVSIREALGTLNPMERKVAEYILDHPSEVINLSVQKLAELAGVSEATIIRFSRSLNFKGFHDLKLKLVADLSQPSEAPDSYQEIRIDGSVRDLVHTLSHNNIRSIQDTLSVLSVESVERAIELLSQARKIGVFGVGASGVIAQDFKQKVTRINRWCEAGYGFDEQATIAATMTDRDVAFGISYSGRTEDIIKSLEVAKANGAAVVTMTKFGKNPVAELADVNLFISSLEQSIRSGAMASRIAQLNVIDILYVGMASRSYESSIQALEKTREAVRTGKRHG